jgi:hypothetical protein
VKHTERVFLLGSSVLLPGSLQKSENRNKGWVEQNKKNSLDKGMSEMC